MQIIRNFIDETYPFFKQFLFLMNANNAHKNFTRFSRIVDRLGLEKFLFDNIDNLYFSPVVISNAAGFNKNGEIPLRFMEYLGFDRVVVGTVCAKPFYGNPEPNIKRFRKTESMVNWMGLPGKGVEFIAQKLKEYKSEIPITINLAPTPDTKNVLDDIARTLWHTRNILNIDRYELNISCPNTNKIEDFKFSLKDQIEVLEYEKMKSQEIYLKISPDLEENEVDIILESVSESQVKGITCTNSTKFHDEKYIYRNIGKGGASGEAVYEKSLQMQKNFYNKMKKSELKIVACGGINSRERLIERINNGASEIQIFTPLIFKGPKLLRELRTTSYPVLQASS